MTVVTVPLDEEMTKMLNNILSWTSSTKADVFRNALREFHDEKLLERLQRLSKEAKTEGYLTGDLDKLAKEIDE